MAATVHTLTTQQIIFYWFNDPYFYLQPKGSTFGAALAATDSSSTRTVKREVKVEVKNEPLASDSEDDIPLSSRLKGSAKKRSKPEDDDIDYEASPAVCFHWLTFV